MTNLSLTKGALKKIIAGDDETVKDSILQVQSMKNIQNNQDGMTRYKISLFDGESQHTFAILATQKNNLVEDNELKVGSVIKLKEYAANVLSKEPRKVVIILLEFDILGDMELKSLAASSTDEAAVPAKGKANNENIEPAKTTTTPASISSGVATKTFFNNKEQKQMPKTTTTTPVCTEASPGMFNGFKICDISNLNPYQNKWSIKARVTNKPAIRTYTNAKGDGKLFNVELTDRSSVIRATGFNDQCDKFYDLLQLDGVYYISRATLKPANKQYSTLSNDYELTFGNETVIEQCHDQDTDDNLPKLSFNFVKFSELPSRNASDFVDVIGIVKSVGDVVSITTKQQQREVKKRDLHLVDQSNFGINCTLWGKQAEEFDGSDKPVLALKGAKVSDYGGRTLGTTGNTVVLFNPDIQEAHALKGWFEQGFDESKVQDLSNQMGGSGSQGTGMTMQSAFKTLDQVRDENLGMGDKPDYFNTLATVVFAKKDGSMYKACPGENCNKKVIDQNDGNYRCEKCGKEYNTFKWRLMLSVNIADFSESTWATCFETQAEVILGEKSQEIGRIKESGNEAKFDEIFSQAVFKQFNFKLRAKMETFNDEKRVKVSVVNVDPIDYKVQGKRLLQKIKLYAQNQID